MFATAFMAILAMVGWLAFATAAHPGHWQGRDRDGVIAFIGAAMGLIFTPIVAPLDHLYRDLMADGHTVLAKCIPLP